jgi:hypothetical protein
MEKVYLPKSCQKQGEVEAEWSGSVTVKVPSVSEYMDILGVAKGMRNAGDDAVDSLVAMKPLLAVAKKHIVKCDLVYVKSGKKFDSWDALEEDLDAMPVVIELAAAVSGGFKVAGE